MTNEEIIALHKRSFPVYCNTSFRYCSVCGSRIRVIHACGVAVSVFDNFCYDCGDVIEQASRIDPDPPSRS